MRRLRWLRRITAAVVAVSLAAALGFALKRGTVEDRQSGGSPHGHPADLESVPSNLESGHGDEVESGHGDEAESEHGDGAEPEHGDGAEPEHGDEAEAEDEHDGHGH